MVHKTSASKSNQTPVENLIFDPAKMSFNDYIAKNAYMFLPGINTRMVTMGGLKLELLPPIAKEYFVRWLFEVNRRRLEQGLPLMVTYDIIKQCPLWKVIPMPYRNIRMDKETLAKLNKMVPPHARLNFSGIKLS